MLESALEVADFNTESADFSTDFVVVGRLPILNMFDNSQLIQSVNGN